MTSIISEFIDVALKALRKNKKVRLAFFVFIILATFLFIFLIMISREFSSQFEIVIRDLSAPIFSVLGLAFFISLLSFTKIDLSKRNIDADLEALRAERIEIQKRIADTKQETEKSKETIFDTIQLSLNQISEYYTINKSQARSSFNFSIFAIITGLVTLIGGIWLFYFKDTPRLDLTIISSISSVIVEFIGGAYFYIYNKSQKQLNYFYDKLVKMQDTMLAVQLCESLPQEKEIEQKEKMITILMERSSPEISKNG